MDDLIGEPRPRLRISIDQDRLEFFGVEQRDVYDTLQALLGAMTVGYSHRGEDRNPIEIAVRLPKHNLSWSEMLASTPVPANTLPGNRSVVELGDVVRATKEVGSPVIFRRDGRFADMVMAELAGAFEAPIYGMLEVAKQVDAHDWNGLPKPAILLHGQPKDEAKPAISRARDLAPVRACVFDLADCSRHPCNLRRAARCKSRGCGLTYRSHLPVSRSSPSETNLDHRGRGEWRAEQPVAEHDPDQRERDRCKDHER